MEKILVILFIFLLMIGCKNRITNQKEDTEVIVEKSEDIKAIIVTAKYCHNFYPESYFYPGSDTLGINLYFAGQIINNTYDPVLIPNKEKKINFSDQLEQSLFYCLINGDTLYFQIYYPKPVIPPFNYITIQLQRHIKPDEVKWINIFRNIGKDQNILDTMKIRYVSPNFYLEKRGTILPSIVFEHSSNFRIDTASYNSYFEHIFKRQDYYEDLLKEVTEGLVR